MSENKIIEAEFTEIIEPDITKTEKEKTTKAKEEENVTDLIVFTAKAVQPIKAEYLELSSRYVEIRTRLHELVDSVKDVEVTEDYLDEATKIQREVNKLWKEIETARKDYRNFVNSVFYDPIAEKIEKEIKLVFQEWENTFKASKTNIENELLEQRVNKTADWFSKTATEQGLDWLTLQDALQQKAVTVTRKNKSTDIVKASNAFIDKVKSDITVLRDGYGDEEIAEYRKTFNAATAIATVKARQAELDAAKQITVTPDAPLVQEVVPVAAAQTPKMNADGKMTRVWELTGTREQLTALAKTAIELGIEYKPLGGK